MTAAPEHVDGTVRLRIDSHGVTDVEVAAVSVAVAALLGGQAAAPEEPPRAPAWRRAGMREASTARRIRSPAELRDSEAR